jgi:hypothetical protein
MFPGGDDRAVGNKQGRAWQVTPARLSKYVAIGFRGQSGGHGRWTVMGNAVRRPDDRESDTWGSSRMPDRGHRDRDLVETGPGEHPVHGTRHEALLPPRRTGRKIRRAGANPLGRDARDSLEERTFGAVLLGLRLLATDRRRRGRLLLQLGLALSRHTAGWRSGFVDAFLLSTGYDFQVEAYLT